MPSPAAALVAAHNRRAPSPAHTFEHLGDVPFGPEVVHTFRLANGLRVLALVDRQAPTVSYFTWFRVGSRDERPGKTGLAHLFEHLMFNETEGLAAGQFDRKLEESGAESNAATWVDWTYYYESVPRDRLGLVVRLEAERMARLVLREPQVASEREVVMNERRYAVEDSVEGTANEALYKAAFTRHPYGWPTLGWMDDIRGLSPADCESFYAAYYAPNNATLVVVGDVRLGDLLARVARAYAAIPRGAVPEEDTQPEPPQAVERRVHLELPTQTTKVLVGYRGPALGDPSHAALSLLNEVLFGGRASRLYERMIVAEEIATELRGWVTTFKDPGLYELYLTARAPHGAGALLAALDDELDRVTRELVTEEELERARARLSLGLLQALDSAAGKAEQIGFFDSVLGDPAGAHARIAAFERVTRGEVRTAARRYLVPEARTVVVVEPRRGEAAA